MTTKAEIREYFAKFGKQGGKKRAKNMTPEERKEASRKAAQARWGKPKKLVAQT
jgi:general stress protein YciG